MTKPAPTPTADRPDRVTPTWLRFFESGSGPTLITVLLGGIFGTIVTTTVQQAISARERIRTDQKAVVQARLTTVQDAFSLLGRMMGTAEDLIVSRGPEYDLERFSDPQERAQTVAQLHAIHGDYNATDRQWRSTRYGYALLLAYYHPGRTAVPRRWTALTKAVNGYVDCARGWAVSNTRHLPYDGSCDHQRQLVEDAIIRLSEAIVDTEGGGPASKVASSPSP